MADFSSIIKVVAPWIGTALGGPLGGLAVEAASNALGLSTRTADALKTAIGGATPEQMLALKNADQAFALQMQTLGFKNEADLEAIVAGDRDSARKMQVSARSWVPGALAVFVTLGFFGILVGLLRNELDTNNQAILIMLGSLGTAWTGIIAYYFGSSAGSSRKDELLAHAPAIKN